MNRIPPSAARWIDEVAVDLLDGRRILVRALPQSGKSWLASELKKELGDSAVYVHGKQFSKADQPNLIQTIRSTVRNQRTAQLIFDDYHAALASRGKTLQTQLYNLLIDADIAYDIGAVFLSRQIPQVDLPGRGSPLISRFDHHSLPEWTSEDLDFLQVAEESDELRLRIGTSITDLRRYIGGGYGQVVDRLRADKGPIHNDLPIQALAAITDEVALANAGTEIDRSVTGLAVRSGGRLRLTDAAQAADIGTSDANRNIGWPSDFEDCVDRFANLLRGENRFTWCDRYLYTDVARLRSFLEAVRKRTSCTLQLLAAESVGGYGNRSPIDKAAAQRLGDIAGIFCKTIRPLDYSALHDRHLARSGAPGGYVLPTFDVVTAKAKPGSSIVTTASEFSVSYDEIWARSTPLR